MIVYLHQNNTSSRLSWIQVIFLIFLLVASAPRISQARDAHANEFTPEQRVICQTTIENIRWSHRIWPSENPTPKPSRIEVLSDQQIREKVADNLRMEKVLVDLYGIQITQEMLQAELDRMGRNTKSPERLRELFAALGNDPVLLGECIARPELVQRQLFAHYAQDNRYHGALRQQALAALARGDADPATLTASGAIENRQLLVRSGDDAYSTPFDPPPAGNDEDLFRVELAPEVFDREALRLTDMSGDQIGLRETDTAFILEQVLDRTEKGLDVQTLIWNKLDFDQWWRSQAAAAQPIDWTAPILSAEADSMATSAGSDTVQASDIALVGPVTLYGWTPTSTAGAPDARSLHAAVWTGSEMIIWGGNNVTTGGRYDPVFDSWTPTSTAGAPTGRSYATVVWTGTEMVIWGGWTYTPTSTYLNTGGRYNPATNSWTATTTGGAPAGRRYHTAVWSGTEMIVWGGESNVSPYYLNTGGRYNPAANSWTATATTGAPSGRTFHTAVWTGTEMIVWGGGPSYANIAGRYNPAGNSWTAATATGAPSGRTYHTAVWTGTEMIVWGGSDGIGGNFLNTGGRYDPAADSWTAPTTTSAPTGRNYPTAVWTGTEMIIWGGMVPTPTGTNTGGHYDPGTDSWFATTATDAPAARYWHSAIWTGSEMIVWGGNTDSGAANTGGRYSSYPAYTVGGTVTGLAAGNSVVLQNNGEDDLTVDLDGPFTFATPLADGSGYTVSVLTQPDSPAQYCSITNASGTISGADVTDVEVACEDAYTVGGTVTGLAAGNSVVLQNNGVDDLTVSNDGPFTFATALADGTGYAVSVLTQPDTPNQTCSVSSGSGTVAGADITDVSVTCVTNTYTVGGTVTGLAAGNSVVLQNNGVDDLTVSNDGPFTFATALADGTGYAVSVLAQPDTPNQTCGVSNGSGTIAGADVTDVGITCVSGGFDWNLFLPAIIKKNLSTGQ
ncbi:MAG: Kelch repeat-containing protein [Thermodesulfobacteriota bacterium]